eukprot:1358851-Pleurochrysis_carterae.AAC.1
MRVKKRARKCKNQQQTESERTRERKGAKLAQQPVNKQQARAPDRKPERERGKLQSDECMRRLMREGDSSEYARKRAREKQKD